MPVKINIMPIPIELLIIRILFGPFLLFEDMRSAPMREPAPSADSKIP